MGYDVHVTRAAQWSHTAGAEIKAEEWLRWVEADPELALDPESPPCLAVWRSADGTAEGWIDWSEGRLFTKNPSAAMLRKLLAVAEGLGARVQGDDRELYDASSVHALTADGSAAPGERAMPSALRRYPGLALLAAGQVMGWLALLFGVWTLRVGGNSAQTGRVGAIGDRLFPAFVALAAAGTAVAAAGFARRAGRDGRRVVLEAVGVTVVLALANHLSGWRLFGAPVHPLRSLLGEATFAIVALAEIALGAWLLSGGYARHPLAPPGDEPSPHSS